MPVFEYKGLNEAGKSVSGLQEADSAKSLRTQLRRNGVFLTDVLGTRDASGAKIGGKGKGKAAASLANRDVDLKRMFGGRVSTSDVAIATRQLATLLGAGVPLVDALSALVDQVEKERFKRILSEVKQRVNEGISLGDALAQHQSRLRGALREHGARRRGLGRAGRGAQAARGLHREPGQAEPEDHRHAGLPGDHGRWSAAASWSCS